MMFHGESCWWGMWMMWLPLLIIVIILILKLLNDYKAKLSSNNSLDILKNRYAKGEITTEEFEVTKKSIN